MGWTFTHNGSKAEVIAEILAPWNTTVTAEWLRYYPEGTAIGTAVHSTVIAKQLVGNSLWYVRTTVHTPPGGAPVARNWIGLSLLENRGGWGYKDMDESMGPYDWSCPVAFLALAPQPEGDSAAEWRAKVRAGGSR
jgi:hypothetical protein